MCHFDSIVSLGDVLDNLAFDQFRKSFVLQCSGVLLSIRLFFTISDILQPK